MVMTFRFRLVLSWVLSWVLLLVLANVCRAQDDALMVGYFHQEDSRVVAPNNGGLLATVFQDRLALPLGMRKTHTGYWFTGVHMQQTLITFHGSNVGERRLYRLALPIDYIHDPLGASDWKFTARLAPSHYSDERIWDHRATDMDYALKANYAKNSHVEWVLGVIADRRLGQARYYPTMGVQWQASSRWYHHWVFPDWRTEFQWRKATQLYAHMRPDGGQWRYGKYNNHLTMHYVNWSMGVGVRHKTRTPFTLQLELGQNLYRKLIYDQGTISLNDSPYWQVSIESRFE